MEQVEKNTMRNPMETPSLTISILPRDENIIDSSTKNNDVKNSSLTNHKKDDDGKLDDLEFSWKQQCY